MKTIVATMLLFAASFGTAWAEVAKVRQAGRYICGNFFKGSYDYAAMAPFYVDISSTSLTLYTDSALTNQVFTIPMKWYKAATRKATFSGMVTSATGWISIYGTFVTDASGKITQMQGTFTNENYYDDGCIDHGTIRGKTL